MVRSQHSVVIRAPGLINEGSAYITPAAQRIDLDDRIRWDTGVAVTAGQYEVGRDADATNQLHFNVPTGATMEFSVNDVAEAVLSATSLSLENNTLLNVGNANNDWLANSLTVKNANSGANMALVVENTSDTADSSASLTIRTGGASAGDPFINFVVTAAEMTMGLDNSASDAFTIADGGNLGTTDRLRLARETGILDLDGTSALTAAVVGLFDEYDDALVLRNLVWGEFGLISEEQRQQNRELLFQAGVLVPKNPEQDPDDPNGYFIRIQPMIHLLAGGIYQTRMRMDERLAELEERVNVLGRALPGGGDG